jgi:DNA-binding NtrC family response regulator
LPVQAFYDRLLGTLIRLNPGFKGENVEIDISSEDFEPVGNGKYFIGISPPMRILRASATRVAEGDSPVAIIGEQGSGRETVARLLHTLSRRSGSEFARVNCAALSEEQLEQEMFGFECASGTEPLKHGTLEACDGGTVFFDEIPAMPLRLQRKLAETIRERRFIRKDGLDCVRVDVRVVAASSIPVDLAVAQSLLLEGLAGELGVCELRVPALRERKEELPLLCCYFMHRLAKRHGLPPRQIARSVSEAWQIHEWPGNLLELEQSVERYLMAGDGESPVKENPPVKRAAEPARALFRSRNGNGQSTSGHAQGGIHGFKSLRELLQSVKKEAERSAIAWALETTGWNRKAAARLLRTSYRTVLYKIEQYHISSSDLSAAPTENGFESGGTRPYGDGRTDIHAASMPDLHGSRLSE